MGASVFRHGVAAILLAALAVSWSGCAPRRAPRQWLPYAQEAQQQAYGGWLELHRQDPDSLRSVQGELLAIANDSVYTLSGTTITASAISRVRGGTLEAYDTGAGDVARMAVAGTLLSVTTGWGLVVLAPAWFLVGTVSSSMLSGRGTHELTPGPAPDDRGAKRVGGSWHDLRLHARFPQGLPPALDRASLRERPLHVRTKPVHRRSGSILK